MLGARNLSVKALVLFVALMAQPVQGQVAIRFIGAVFRYFLQIFGFVDCPQAGGGFCSLVFDPVICDGRCEYSNSCFAGLAGFETMDCESVGDT